MAESLHTLYVAWPRNRQAEHQYERDHAGKPLDNHEALRRKAQQTQNGPEPNPLQSGHRPGPLA